MPTARDAAAELIHKAATVTFNNPHIARAINTWRDKNQNKKKEKENTFLLCQVCLQSNGSLNSHYKGICEK